MPAGTWAGKNNHSARVRTLTQLPAFRDRGSPPWSLFATLHGLPGISLGHGPGPLRPSHIDLQDPGPMERAYPKPSSKGPASPAPVNPEAGETACLER